MTSLNILPFVVEFLSICSFLQTFKSNCLSKIRNKQIRIFGPKSGQICKGLVYQKSLFMFAILLNVDNYQVH